jgi:rfaE bifunctional protein kinase chain/domain
VKTRIIARQQQVVRVDRELIAPLAANHVANVTEAVRKNLPNVDAIIFEDYGKGFLGSELIAQIIKDAGASGKIIAADPNPGHALDWSGTTVVKPNRAEAFLAAGITPRDSDASPPEDKNLLRVGEILLKKWKTKLLLITLGEQGMMLFQQGHPPHHIPTKARQVFDVSGAGDTAIALFTLALCSGATPTEAAEIANHASAVVVAKLGTATVARDELVASFREDFERA